jgi:uncharacterized membrane protein (UPF0127 family)
MELIKVKLKNLEIEAIYIKGFSIYRGLMFKKEGNALLEFPEEKRYKIWTLFMRYPLDLIFINKDKRVVEIMEDTLPITLNPKTWRFYKPVNSFRYLLELDARKKLSVFFRVNDVLEW